MRVPEVRAFAVPVARAKTIRPVRAVALAMAMALAGCEHSGEPPDALPTFPQAVEAAPVTEKAAPGPIGKAELEPEPIEAPAEPTKEPTEEPTEEPTRGIQALEKPEYLRHKAAPMETLQQVASRYGVSVERLRRWNGLSEEYALFKVWRKPKLKVWARRRPPARTKVQHTAVAEDTWGSIARAYGAASTDMRAYNIKNVGRKIEPGEVLDIWVDPIVLAEVQGPPRADGLRRGAYSIGSPNEGQLVNGVKLPPSPDYELSFPNSVWGTTYAVGSLIRGLHAWRVNSSYAGVLRIGTMSRQRGGEVGHHKSHQSGRDIDIRLPLKEDVPQGLKPEAWRVDWWATYQLIDTLVSQPEVSVVFFDYKLQKRLAKAAEAHGVDAQHLEELLQWPIGSKASRGHVKHEPGHTKHIHVRFHCGPYETECVEK